MRICLQRVGLGLLLLLPLLARAASPPSGPGGKPPEISITTNGLTSGYAVRFGAPVDHELSRLQIMQAGRVLETLHARLNSAPDVLFARGRALSSGTYDLHWTVKSLTDGSVSEGDTSFTIEPPRH
jgi:hypothetical protein